MSDTTNTSVPTVPAVQAPAPAPAVPVTQATAPTPEPAKADVMEPSAALRTALIRAHAERLLGPVPASWVLDAAMAAAKPDLAADFSGLTDQSKAALGAWKSQNAFAFQAAAPQTQAAPAATGAPVQQPTQPAKPAEALPATPASALGAAGGLSADDLRRLNAVHVDPKTITNHPDWNRTKAFWGIA